MPNEEIPISPSSPDEIHIGPLWLTRFELARVMGSRSLQISMGAPTLIDTPPEIIDANEIAELEVKSRVLPVSVRRTLPNGMFQDIPLIWLLPTLEQL
ncbi:MAG: DNA-directed RNA polymerase subunit K [Candidatus Heimdallarchaeota archaeon]